jgi:hypothetical protein
VVVVSISIPIACAIMIVVVPIPLGPPAMAIFIPPAVIRPPTPLALFVQFVARIVGLRALVSIMFDGFVQPVIGPRNPALTVVVCLRPWNRGYHQKTRQRHRRQSPFPKKYFHPSISHKSSILLRADFEHARERFEHHPIATPSLARHSHSPDTMKLVLPQTFPRSPAIQ